jgi:hypothetical protein
MKTFEAATEVNASPSQVIDLLTDPTAARTWSPVDFEIDAADARLETGTQMEVGGQIIGRRVSFDLSIEEASRHRLMLTASGPLRISARYDAEQAETGTHLRASVSVDSAGGIRGRIVSSAAEALLAGGALHLALDRIARTAAAPA